MTESPFITALRDPQWLGAIAGAAAAGAVLAPQHRLLGALVGAGAMLAVAYWRDGGGGGMAPRVPAPSTSTRPVGPSPDGPPPFVPDGFVPGILHEGW